MQGNLQEPFEKETSDSQRGKYFFCGLCGKAIACKKNLNAHYRVFHTDEKSVVCEVCNKKFLHKWGLKSHMWLHTGEKAFVCSICNKKYAHKSSLQKHLLAGHTGEKPFKCELCNKRYVHKTSLDAHLQCHSNMKTFMCSLTAQLSDNESEEKNSVLHD